MTKKQQKQIEWEFKSWLGGVQEDDPLPLEIKYIYFIVDFSNNNIELSYSGSEMLQDTYDYAEFFPLEAQCFFCTTLFDLAKKPNFSKQQILSFLKPICKNVANQFDFLKNKIVLFGERWQKIVV